MNGYHCYILTKEGRVSSREGIECATDADALAKAAYLAEWNENFPEVEVWNGARLVGRTKLRNGEG